MLFLQVNVFAMSTAVFGDVNLHALMCIGQHVQLWPVYISGYLR